MKRLVLAGLGALAIVAAAGSANAADMPRRAAPAPAPVYKAPPYQAYNWTGLYAGINGGYGFGNSNVSGFPGTGDFDVNGGMVGGTLGYNWQTGPVVFGLETDLDWSGMKGSAACGAFNCETKNTWLGTTRGRIGYAWDRFMPYITGGAAYGNVKASSLLGSTSDTNFGWTVGAGAEFALAGNWTAKLEYLYADLGDVDCGAACTLTPPANVDFHTNIVRAGLNYRF
jgi:outer membrane immunogenic protein